jgi:hypothetical protein
MKSLILGMLIISAAATAQTAPTVSIKNFNFTYQNPHGEGSATSFSRSNFKADQGVTVAVDKIDKDFKLIVSGSENQEFEFKNAPSFMTEAESIAVSGFNLEVEDKLTLNLLSGRFNSEKDELNLDNLSLDCSRDVNQKELTDQFISGCIQKMNLKTAKFSQSGEEGPVSVLKTVVENSLDDQPLLGNIGVSSLDLKTNAGKYDLSVEVKAQISGKVKSKGNMSYDPDSGKLTIKISEVKFGFLNITSKVFDELKKQQSETLKVNEPYVYYLVK